MLNEATSSDDSPTPGYMLSDIAKSTLANYQACVQLQDFLIARMAKKNHNIKFKSLVIVKHVCRNGRLEFKRDMARRVEGIKECLEFKGPPDPLRGDQIYERVRVAAREALEAVFDSQMPVTTSAVAAANRIQGMSGGYGTEQTSVPAKRESGIFSSVSSALSWGSSSDESGSTYAGAHGDTSTFSNVGTTFASGGGGISGPVSGLPGAYNGSTSSMTGIGNPNFSDPRSEKSWTQKISEKIGFGKSDSEKTEKFNSFSGDGVGDYKFTSNRPGNPFSGSGSTSSQGYNPSVFNSSSSSSSWNSSNNPTIIDGYTVSGGGGIVPNLPPTGGLGRAGGAASDGLYEQSMIGSLCEPGGTKAVPPEDKLSAFALTAPTLAPETVGSSLLEHLNSDFWQSRVKALIVVAQLAKTRGCENHIEWWVQNGVEDIRSMNIDQKSSVRTQALKTLRALKVSAPASAEVSGGQEYLGAAPSPSAPIATQAAVPSPSLNLLDTDDFTYAPASPPPPVPVPVDTASVAPVALVADSTGDLFAGMAMGSSVSNASPLAPNISAFTTTVPPGPFAPPVVPVTAAAMPAQPSLLATTQTTASKAIDLMSMSDDVEVSGERTSMTGRPDLDDILGFGTLSMVGANNIPIAAPNGSGFHFVQGGMTPQAGGDLAAQNAYLQQQLQMQQLQMQQMQMQQMQIQMMSQGGSVPGGFVGGGLPMQMNGAGGAVSPQRMGNMGMPPFPPGPRGYPQVHPLSLGTTMGSVVDSRKVIPGIDEPAPPSGFSFMAGGPSGASKAKKADDSFGFVLDAMKASK